MTSNRTTLTALAAGALMLGGGGVAAAQTPYGAYQSTPRVPTSCRNVENLASGYVSAECETSGGFRWSTIRAVDCRSDLSNRDGVLTCAGATATVGPLYPHGSSGSVQTSAPTGPGDVIGALLGAVFGVGGQSFEDDWDRGRRPLAERRGELESRIDAGVRDGSISYAQASRLRTDYDGLVQLETRYAADGRLTVQERADLRQRYEALYQRVDDGHGYGYGDSHGQWRPLADERYAFDARVDAAVRARRISTVEATRLRADFQTLMRREADYARGGLTAAEREDLTRRYAELNRRIGDDGGYGGGQYGGQYGGQDARAVEIEARIAAGVRSGQLNRTEAERLRAELRDLTRRWSTLEDRVRRLR